MTPLDPVLALAGWTATGIERRGGSGRAVWVVVLILFALSAIPTFLIGSNPRPTDLTFDDVRLSRIPAMTTWVRVEGDLRLYATGAVTFYRLHDPDDDASYIVVSALAPLEEGRVAVTGIIHTGANMTGNIGAIDADVPAVPKRNEPFGLILLPAAIGAAILIGRRLGYPVIRAQRPSPARAARLGPGERVTARWSGRIVSEVVAHAAAVACTVGVSADADLSYVSVDDGTTERTVRVRRQSPSVRPVKASHLGHTEPGLEIHSQASDLVLVFDDRATRDRLLNTLL